MNSAMQVSKIFSKRQCIGTSFASKRSFISLTNLAHTSQASSNHKCETIKLTSLIQRRQLSDTPAAPAAEPRENVERDSLIHGPVSPEIKQLTEDILNLNVIDFEILMEIVQRKLGVSDIALSAMIGGVGGGGGGGGGGGQAAAEVEVEVAEPVKEREAWDIKLTVVDPKSKIKIIKEVRALTGLGLKEAKDLVEKAPVVIKTGVKKEEIDAIKKILIDAGATIEII